MEEENSSVSRLYAGNHLHFTAVRSSNPARTGTRNIEGASSRISFTIMWEAASSNLHLAAVTGIVSTVYRQPQRDTDYVPKMSECFNYRIIHK